MPKTSTQTGYGPQRKHPFREPDQGGNSYVGSYAAKNERCIVALDSLSTLLLWARTERSEFKHFVIFSSARPRERQFLHMPTVTSSGVVDPQHAEVDTDVEEDLGEMAEVSSVDSSGDDTVHSSSSSGSSVCDRIKPNRGLRGWNEWKHVVQ